MDERERFIRSKYERRQYYGAPSASSLRAAAEDAEMKFEALPPGYMEGVDTTQVAAAAGLADAGSAAVNPALARRLAKKAAEDEAVAAARRAEEAAAHKLKEDAELAARVAAEAERRAVGERRSIDDRLIRRFTCGKPTQCRRGSLRDVSCHAADLLHTCSCSRLSSTRSLPLPRFEYAQCRGCSSSCVACIRRGAVRR